jgi:hypothetical protein
MALWKANAAFCTLLRSSWPAVAYRLPRRYRGGRSRRHPPLVYPGRNLRRSRAPPTGSILALPQEAFVNRLVRILPIAASLIGAILIVGCADEFTAPSEPSFAEIRQESTPPIFTPCRAQAETTAAAWIGPKGGILKAGKHTLKVPPGALSTPVWITMVAPSSSINRIVFSPSGLTFNSAYPAYLVMSYANCAVAPGSEQQIVHINDRYQVIETAPSQTDPATLTVHGKLLHFSDYALSTYAVVY